MKRMIFVGSEIPDLDNKLRSVDGWMAELSDLTRDRFKEKARAKDCIGVHADDAVREHFLSGGLLLASSLTDACVARVGADASSRQI